MKYQKMKLLNPWFIVFISVFLSVFMYLIISVIFTIPAFELGLMISILIPIAVSVPVSIITLGYYKKVEHQKDELHRLNAINKKIISVISHEVRSPLATIKGVTDIIVEGGIGADETAEYFEPISQHVNSVLYFLEDLMQWSLRQVNNEPLVPVVFKTGDIILPVLNLFDNMLKSKNITVETEGFDVEIFIDKGVYSFVVRNVLHNAIKFTPKGGIIKVCISENNDKVYTSVKDNGKGMTPEIIEKVTKGDKWFTQKGTENEKGTGFGIKTCIDYLKDSKGKLIVESEVNKGTTIKIATPIKTDNKK